MRSVLSSSGATRIFKKEINTTFSNQKGSIECIVQQKVFLDYTLWLLLELQCQCMSTFSKSQKVFLLALDPLRQISADLNKAKEFLALILHSLLLS